MIYTNPTEIKKIVELHRERYPLMTEEDVVKLIFQGLVGGGHLISSAAEALRLLLEEMEELKADENEPLIEIVSREWFRLNLRAAKARGIKEEDIAFMLCETAKKPVNSDPVRVYYICTRLDNSEQMKEAAFRIVDDDCPPPHSAQYWHAYQPAYRVLHKDFHEHIKQLALISCENRGTGPLEDSDDPLSLEAYLKWYRSSGGLFLPPRT